MMFALMIIGGLLGALAEIHPVAAMCVAASIFGTAFAIALFKGGK